MQTVIMYVDDVQHALSGVKGARAEGVGARRWVLVACPPRVTHHVSRWVTRSARESWRSKWAHKLFAQLLPALDGMGDEVITCMGDLHLQAQSEALLRQHPSARIIDARRPRGPIAESGSGRPGLMTTLMTAASPALWLAFE